MAKERKKIDYDLFNPYNLDWGEEIYFPSSRNVKEYGNRIYNRYPARSIFLVPRAILSSKYNQGLSILDPFMGSGTTAVETVLSGNIPFGIEMDPFARMVAEVSSYVYEESEISEIKHFATSILKHWNTYDSLPKPSLTGIDRWFKVGDIEKLLKLKNAILSISPEKYKHFFLIVFADCIKPVSLMERQSLKPYISTKFPKITKDVESSFSYSFDAHITALEEMSEEKKPQRSIIWIGDDATDFSLDNPQIDVAITSPPYINALDYTRCIKIESAFCDTIDNTIANELRKKQVGHERRKNQKIEDFVTDLFEPFYKAIYPVDQARAMTCRAYFNDMYKNFECVYNALKVGGEYHVIIGDNTIKNVDIPTHELLLEIGIHVGFNCFGYYKYAIKDHRTSIPRNCEKSKIGYEHVIMLRK